MFQFNTPRQKKYVSFFCFYLEVSKRVAYFATQSHNESGLTALLQSKAFAFWYIPIFLYKIGMRPNLSV